MAAVKSETKTKHKEKKSSKKIKANDKFDFKKNRHLTTKESVGASSTSTRVCIKNLPPTLTSLQLRDFLTQEFKNRAAAAPLVITDCHVLLHPKKKTSRRIAFVGCQTTTMAQLLMEKFDHTFCLTSRLVVEPAKGTPKQQHHQQQPAESNETKGMEAKHVVGQAKKKEGKENVTKKALLGIGASKAKFWSNDFDLGGGTTSQDTAQQQEEQSALPNKPDKNSDNDSVSSTSNRSSGSDSSDDDADPLASKTLPKPIMSDLEFLKSKQSFLDDLDVEDGKEDDVSSSDSDDSNSSNNDGSSQRSATVASPSDHDNKAYPVKSSPDHSDEATQNDNKRDDENDQSKVASNRLFIRNLPFTTTEQDLEEHFSTFGPVEESHIPVDDRKMSKGFAFVTFSKHQDATLAMENMDGTDFQGRFLHVMKSRQKPSESAAFEDPAKPDRPLSYKERQELARRQDATKSTQGWSASFVRGDAVVDSLADRLGLRKGDILNVKGGLSSGDAAVRLALGETQVIEENREYFKDHGVDMETLISSTGSGDESGKRSTTSLLVKNLPFDTQEEELTKMFHGVGGGAPNRILLPPSRTIALVEYGHGSDAKRAFRKLAYRRFKNVPLYLEWAPLEASIASSNNEAKLCLPTDEGNRVENESSAAGKITTAETEEDVEESGLDGPTPSVYVKNLNFSTSEETLRRVFNKMVGDVRAVRIPTKVAPIKAPKLKDDNKAGPQNEEKQQTLSMGFGFVEFSTNAAARKALSKLQGSLVDGHALELKPSTKSLSKTDTFSGVIKPPSNKKPTKVMVRNVPFQATRTELLKLFGSFGQLKRVRLPKKFDGGHRGFAFVEFVTHKEAMAAVKALSRTHLYGRHLVLEWAEDSEDQPETGLAALREKAKRDMIQRGGDDGSNKRKRKI